MQMYQGEFPCVGATVFVLSMAVAGSLVLSSPATYQFRPRIPTDSTSLRPELVYPQNRFGQSACFFPARRYGFAIRESDCLLLPEKRGLNLTSMGRLRHSCRMGRSGLFRRLVMNSLICFFFSKEYFGCVVIVFDVHRTWLLIFLNGCFKYFGVRLNH